MQLIVSGKRAVLDLQGESLDLKDYKLKSSAQGGTELEMTISIEANTILFETSTSQEA